MPSRGPAPAEPRDGRDRRRVEARPALLVALIGLILMLVGLAAAGPTVAVPGAGLLLLGLLTPAWVLVLITPLHLEARLPGACVVEGHSLGIEISVTGSQLLRGTGAELQHELLREPLRLKRDTRRLVINARPRGRGYLRVTAPRVVVCDPLGLARGSRSARNTLGELLVLPRTEPVRWLQASEAMSFGALPTGVGAGPATIDIAGLRQYRPGTPATRIHWPALARGGDLLERVFSVEIEDAPLVVLDPRLDGGVDDTMLDRVVRATASLTLALASSGAVDLLLPGAGSPLRISVSLATWPAALRALALVASESAVLAPPRIPAGGDSVLFYACSNPAFAAGARAHWKGRLLTLGPEPEPEPTPPAVIPEPTAVLAVAGCVARTVPSRR